jgi:hypothetical protein
VRKRTTKEERQKVRDELAKLDRRIADLIAPWLLELDTRDAEATPTPPDPDNVAGATADEIVQSGNAIFGRHKQITDIVARRIAPLLADKGGCPCLWTTPCSPACSCACEFQSGGCTRCCSYGSDEQRRKTAARLAARDAAYEREEKLMKLVGKFVKAKAWYEQVSHKESPTDNEQVAKAHEDVCYLEVQLRDAHAALSAAQPKEADDAKR